MHAVMRADIVDLAEILMVQRGRRPCFALKPLQNARPIVSVKLRHLECDPASELLILREKDIGVLRLMGFRRWQVFLSFQLESLVIALCGGALGVFLGYLIADGRTATSIASSGGGGGGKSVVLKLVVDFGVIGTGILFSPIMGAFGGILPSSRAMRLRPLESLK